MTQRNKSADLEPLVSREQAENEFRKALNLFVGRNRRYSVDQLSKGSGVPDRSIECFRSYQHGHSDYRPLHDGHKLSIMKFLGADFTTEWLALAGQGAFNLPDADDTPPGALAVDNADDNATLCRAAMDNTFDAHEKPVLKVVGQRMMQRGATLKAMAA